MKVFRKFITWTLLMAMLISSVPTMAFADGTGEESIFNDYMKFSFNTNTGGFAIETAEGNPKKKLDNNLPLLYAEDASRSNGTSFISVRVGKKDYIFGQDYTRLGLRTSLGDITKEGNNLIEIPWTLENEGITVVLKAALETNLESSTTGNVGLSFEVQNTGTEEKNVGIRLLLDTALGNQTDAPYFVVDKNASPTMTETKYEGDKVPGQIRAVDSITNPSRLSYILTEGIGWASGEKPNKVIIGHWANMANTRYDYSPDTDCDFSNYSNDHREPDSAAAIYWENKSLAGGGKFVGEVLYGVGNFSKTASDMPMGINITTGRVTLSSDKKSYENDGKINVIVELDNTADDSLALSDVYVNLKYDTDKFELVEGNEQVKIESLGKEVAPPLYYTLQAYEQYDLCAGSIYVAVAGVRQNSVGGSETFETAAERSVILPSVGTVSEVQMNKVNPNTVYTEGEKAVSISGKMSPLQAVLANDAKVKLMLYHQTVAGESVEILKDDITFLDDSFETLTFTTNKPLVVGEYRIVFEINDDTLRENLQCTSITCDTNLKVSADPKYQLKSYGLIALVRSGSGDNVKYDFYTFATEDEYLNFYKGKTSATGEYTKETVEHNFGASKEDIEDYEVLLTVRANLREMTDPDTNVKFWQADFADGDIILNNMLSYEGDTSLKIYRKDGVFKVEGDGLLKVVNSINVWRKKWSISVTEGTSYTLDESNFEEGSSLTLSLDGAATMIQSLGGFAVDLKYGVLSSEWQKNDIPTYGIGFGGKISIPIKAKTKTDTDQGDDEDTPTPSDDPSASPSASSSASPSATTTPVPEPAKPVQPSLTEDQEDLNETLHAMFDETLSDDQQDISGEIVNTSTPSASAAPSASADPSASPTRTPDPTHKPLLKPATVSSLKDKIKKDDDDDLPEGKLSAEVNNVLFGEKTKTASDGSVSRDTGFIGIDAEFSLALPENVLGSFVSNAPGLEADVKIDTIDNEYEIHAGLSIKIIECEGTLAFKQVKVKNKDTIVPDKIEFYFRGMKIPLAPPTLYMTGLGGGVDNLADTIGGEFDDLPPITILLYTQLEAIGVLSGDFNATITLSSLDLSGKMQLKDKSLKDVMDLDANIYARWMEPWELSLCGNVSIIDGIIQGGITVTIMDNYFYGYVFASIYVPDSIPLVGGKELARVEAAVSHEFIGANVKIIGIRFGVIYYWGDKVSFGKNIDLSPPARPTVSANLIDTQSSANAIGYYGTNIQALPSTLLLGEGATTDNWKSVKIDVDYKTKPDSLLLEIPYSGFGTPTTDNIKVLNPDEENNEITLKADDGIGGGNMLLQSREDGNFIYITVTGDDAAKIKTGTWTVQYKENQNFEITSFSMNGVENIPELSEDGTTVSLVSNSNDKVQKVQTGWTINDAKAGDKGTIDVYLTEDADILNKIEVSNNTGDSLGVNILHLENQELVKVSSPQTKELPEALPDGTYYAVTTLSTTEGISLAISKDPISFTNPNLPKTVQSVAVKYGGNGELFVSVTDADIPDYTHYLAEIVECDSTGAATGTVLSNNIGQFGRGSNFVFGKEALLKPGSWYFVRVKTLREEYKTSDGEYKKHYYYGSGEKVSEPFQLPTPNIPKLAETDGIKVNFDTEGEEINTNVKDVVIEYNFENEVFVEMDLNGGKVYAFGEDPNPKDPNFSYFRNYWRFVLDDLDDGDYVIDFTAYTKDKDHLVGSKSGVKNAQLAFTVDTSAPVLSLAQQVNQESDELPGAIFRSNTLFVDGSGAYVIDGMTEVAAKLTLDGQTIDANTENVELASNGRFKISKQLADNETFRTHLLTATDKAGNVSEMTVYVMRKGAFTFDNLALYLDGKEIETNENGEKTVTLKNGQQSNLTVYANAGNGQKFVLENDSLEWNVLYSKNSIEFNEGEILALSVGETAIKTKLASGNALTLSGAKRSEGLSDYVIINIKNNSRTDLLEKIDEAKEVLADNPDASEEKISALQSAIDDAETLVNNQQATEDDFTEGVTNLTKAISAFKRAETNSSGGGTRYNVTIAKTENGTVKVSQARVYRGESLTVTAVPDEGYVVADMRINGISVGREESYTIRSVKENILVEVDFAEQSDLPFTDVLESDWFYPYVKTAYRKGYMLGMSETKFQPNVKLSRAMFVTILHRIDGEPQEGENKFVDVAEDAYYKDAVAWATANGIVNGISDTEFAPEANITREQMATILYRYAKYKNMDVSVGENTNILSYDDFDSISEYAIEALQYAVGSGLMVGKTESTLNPLEHATRAEAATVFVRFAEMIS